MGALLLSELRFIRIEIVIVARPFGPFQIRVFPTMVY